VTTSSAPRGPLRVGIDGGTWSNRRGYGRFTREVVSALAELDRNQQYTLFLDQQTPPGSVPSGITVATVPTRVSPSTAAAADGYRSPRDLLSMARAIARAPIDVMFFPSVYTFVPVLRRRLPTVVGVHDVIAERFPDLVFPTRRARLFWRVKVALALRQASLVVTVSQHARDGVERVLGVPRGRIRLTSEAPAPCFRPPADPQEALALRARLGVGDSAPFVVYVGGIAPHKNLLRLVRAFATLTARAEHADARLVLVGDYAGDVFHSAFEDLRALIARVCPGRALFTGPLDDRDVATLLGTARALALVSFDEGFGLPGVEAAACGTAVIATRESALPEVLGDAAIYVDPNDEEAIVDALASVLGDESLARGLGERAQLRAAALSWRASAEVLADVFEELARGVGRP